MIPPWVKEHDELGNHVGKLPHSMEVSELTASGHPKISPLKAIRKNCLDCCCGSVKLVNECGHIKCPLWPFRMGANPFYGKDA
jgi:hypothetical protein